MCGIVEFRQRYSPRPSILSYAQNARSSIDMVVTRRNHFMQRNIDYPPAWPVPNVSLPGEGRMAARHQLNVVGGIFIVGRNTWTLSKICICRLYYLRPVSHDATLMLLYPRPSIPRNMRLSIYGILPRQCEHGPPVVLGVCMQFVRSILFPVFIKTSCLE